jgi:hypothetical protein
MHSLTPACKHMKQSQEWDGLFFPIPLTAQIWHPLTTTCFALQRMHYVDAILQMTTNRNKVFVMCSKVNAKNFTMIYSILLNTGKSVLKIKKSLWKNSTTITKDVQTILANFIIIAITLSEKKI